MERRSGFGLVILCLAIGFVLAACGGGPETRGAPGATGSSGATGASHHRGPTGLKGPTGAASASTGPVVLSLSELKTRASTLGEPIYWAGPEPGDRYEYTRRTDKVWIRYLPEGVEANQKPGQFLIVGTYPVPHAYDKLKEVAKGSGTAGPDGSFVWTRQGDPKSVYIAWPGVPYEVEIYDPAPAKASSTAGSGQVQPVAKGG